MAIERSWPRPFEEAVALPQPSAILLAPTARRKGQRAARTDAHLNTVKIPR